MSTKDLARTAIEGGRCGHYQMEVAAEAAGERAAARAFLRRAAREPDAADDLVDPRRRPVRACFSDKLSPVHRYLDRNCGRPWDKVRSELFARFDIRTTPGRHILFDHVLRDVEDEARWRPRFVVDRHGLLRKASRQQRTRRTWFDERPVFTWLAGRRVSRAGDRFAWWVVTKRTTLAGGGELVRWRPTGLLAAAEERYVRALPSALLERLVSWSPA